MFLNLETFPSDRMTISCNYMPALYQQEKAKVTKKMTDVGSGYFAITTDGQSSRVNNSFISLTVHYVDDQWNTCYHLLETAECSTDHTAANLATGLEEALECWKLPSTNISAATTDNAKNITAAVESLGWKQFGCFAHTLHLGVQKAMAVPEMAKALGQAKRLLSHFHHSTSPLTC